MQPVVLETEFVPAASVEEEAKSRLGFFPIDAPGQVEQAIAVRIPTELRHGQDDLNSRVASSTFNYCLFSGDPDAAIRWPTDGWLTGTVDDIVRCIEHAMLSQRLVTSSMSILERGVSNATNAIQAASVAGFTDTERDLGQVLNQTPGEQGYQHISCRVGERRALR